MADERKPGGPAPTDPKRALLEAAQAAVADAKAKAAQAGPPRRSRIPRVVLMVVSVALAAGSAWMLMTRPSWYFEPPAPPPTPEVQEASVRLTLAREANRVEQFRTAQGRLPASLVELGSPVAGLGYERRGDSAFVLSVPFAGATVTLASTDSLLLFLGRSASVVMPRRGP